MIREGAQDLEARIFLEKALLDPDMQARLGEDLAQRCQQLLDDRVRAILLGRTSWLFVSGGQQRLEKLYALAGEAADKLGKSCRVQRSDGYTEFACQPSSPCLP
jgi:hypothetical protein